MEQLAFTYAGGRPLKLSKKYSMVGVSGSGNLEILIEHKEKSGLCSITITTAAVGFKTIWQAVCDDFFSRHAPTDIEISINDVGATPAVVSLRLDQALEDFTERD